MSFVVPFIENQQTLFWIKLAGSFLLLLFGFYTFRTNPVQSMKPVSHNKGTLVHNFITAFLVTLSNPLIIFLFIGFFARFSFVLPGIPIYEQTLGYLAILCGAVTWWFGITYFVNKVRTRFNLRGIWILNRVIGGIVIIASIAGCFGTLLGKSIY